VAGLVDWVQHLAGTPWAFILLYLFITIDGFFPPVPSETLVIGLASLAASTGSPNVWVLTAVSAAGAFTGDQAAYSIGQYANLRSRRFMRGARQQRAFDRAEHMLAHRGAVFVMAGRYIPVGRVAVNMTAGSLRYPRRRFSVFVLIAASAWAVYSILIGYGAGVWLADRPWLAMIVGVAGGLVLGVVADAVVSRLMPTGRTAGEGMTADEESVPSEVPDP
jgi:membrane-associated protein